MANCAPRGARGGVWIVDSLPRSSYAGQRAPRSRCPRILSSHFSKYFNMTLRLAGWVASEGTFATSRNSHRSVLSPATPSQRPRWRALMRTRTDRLGRRDEFRARRASCFPALRELGFASLSCDRGFFVYADCSVRDGQRRFAPNAHPRCPFTPGIDFGRTARGQFARVHIARPCR